MKVRINMSYEGRHGFLTASKMLEIPFAPYAGMELAFSNPEFFVAVSSDKSLAPVFHTATSILTITLDPVRDWFFAEEACDLDSIARSLANGGWEIEDCESR